MFHAARAGAALLLCGAAGLLLAIGATGASAHTLKKPPGPPGRPTTTVTTTTTTMVPTTTTATVSTTTTVSSTTTASSPPAAAPPQPTADIALTTLTAPGPVYADTSVTYKTVVTNAGPDTATGVFLDVTPIGARVASSQPSAGSCSATDGLQCALGALVTGASAVVSVTYVPDAGSTAFVVDGRAGAEQADPQTANNLSRSLTGVLAGHAGPPVLMSTAAGTFRLRSSQQERDRRGRSPRHCTSTSSRSCTSAYTTGRGSRSRCSRGRSSTIDRRNGRTS